jgi:hypothetical protein
VEDYLLALFPFLARRSSLTDAIRRQNCTDCSDIDSNFALSDIEPVDIFGIEAAQDISTIPSFPIREFWRKVSSLLACVNDDGDTSGIDDES